MTNNSRPEPFEHWPMPRDASRHKDEAFAALREARRAAAQITDPDTGRTALVQVDIAEAQVNATLAGAAVEMEAAAYLADPPTADEEGSEGPHVCADCQARAIEAVRAEMVRFLDATEGPSDRNTETALDLSKIVERVLFGVPGQAPPPSYREQEG